MRKYTTELIDLAQGSEAEKHKVAGRIFTIFSEKTGVDDLQVFYDLFFKKRHLYHALYIFNSSHHHPFGFLSVAVDECQDQDALIIRVSTARNNASRNKFKNITLAHVAYQLIKIRWLYMTRKIYIVFTASSPASYYAFARFVRKIYPDYKQEKIPSDVENIMHAYIQGMLNNGIARLVDGKSHVIVYNELRMIDEDAISWKNKNNAHVNFYLSRCNFDEAEGLVSVVPWQWLDFIYASSKVVVRSIGRGCHW